MGFSRPEYWSGLPSPLPGHLPDPGMEPRSSVLQTGSLPSESPGKPSEDFMTIKYNTSNFTHPDGSRRATCLRLWHVSCGPRKSSDVRVLVVKRLGRWQRQRKVWGRRRSTPAEKHHPVCPKHLGDVPCSGLWMHCMCTFPTSCLGGPWRQLEPSLHPFLCKGR